MQSDAFIPKAVLAREVGGNTLDNFLGPNLE